MKKIFAIALAVAAFAACNKAEVVENAPAAAIAFDNAFVDNATKAATDITIATLANFGVYGTVTNGTNGALLFDNTEVTKSGDAAPYTYTYSPVQYWIEGAQYTFSAYAPYTGKQWAFAPTNADAHKGTLSFDNEAANGEQDLLFASASRSTNNTTISTTPDPISFTFSHLLSKVVFKYTNGFSDGKISLKVYDVKINNAAAKGTIPVAEGEAGVWTAAADDNDYVRSFGSATASAAAALANDASTTTEHFYLIPVNRTYNITFKVDLYQAGVLLQTYQHTVDTEIDIQKGKSYSFNATLTPENVNPANPLYPIEFNVSEVNEWDPATGGSDVTIPVPTPEEDEEEGTNN